MNNSEEYENQEDFFQEFDDQDAEDEHFQVIENASQETPRQNRPISYVKSALRGGMKAGSIISKTFGPSKQKLNPITKDAKDGTSSQRSGTGTNKTQQQNSLYDAFYEAPEDGEELHQVHLPLDIDAEPKS